MINPERYPVLHRLFFASNGIRGGQGNLDRVVPHECCDCPFARVADDDEPPNPADPGEGNYLCLLLGKEEVSRRNDNRKCWTFGLPTVWGEQPLCKEEDWAKRGRQELGLLAPGISKAVMDEAIHKGATAILTMTPVEAMGK